MLRMVIGTPRRRHTDVRPTPSATGPQEPPSTPAPGSGADSTDGEDVDSNPPNANLGNEAGDADSDNIDNNKDKQLENDDLEPWVEYIKRVTRQAEAFMHKHKIQDWVTMQRKMVWRCAARVANQLPHEWPQRVLHWHPSLHTDQTGQRHHGGQWKRWDDDIRGFLKHSLAVDNQRQTQRRHHDLNDITWLQPATTMEWEQLEDIFANHTSP